MASLLDRFRDHLQRARLLARPGTAIVAVSGGSDSVALLDLLQAVAAERGLALVVAHADHQIQRGSGDVGKLVSGLADRYGLPFELGELGLGAASRADLLRLARAAAQERRAWGRLLELVPELGLRRESHGFAVARASLARYDSALSVALLRAAARRVGLVLGPVRARRLVRLASGASGRRVPLGGEWIAEVAFAELRVYRGVACAAEQVVATCERGGAVFGAFRVAWRPEAAPRPGGA